MIGWFSHLESVVKWKPVEENIGEELAEAEDAVDHPVGQPLGVIVLMRTLNGFDPADIRNKGLRTTGHVCEGGDGSVDSRVISWVDETNQITEQRSSVAINQVEPRQRDAPWTGNTMQSKHTVHERPLPKTHRTTPVTVTVGY